MPMAFDRNRDSTRMKRNRMIALAMAMAMAVAVAALSGCAGPVWKTSSVTEMFPKRTTVIVSPGNYTTGNSVFHTSKIYPVVIKEDGDVYVGLMSSGDVPIPVLTAQLWIDQSEVWTISSLETPTILAKPSFELMMGHRTQLTEQALAKGLNIQKIMGGCAVAGGGKARAILEQMLTGRTLKFRTIGIDQTESTIQEVVLDQSFSQALRSVGIDPKRS